MRSARSVYHSGCGAPCRRHQHRNHRALVFVSFSNPYSSRCAGGFDGLSCPREHTLVLLPTVLVLHLCVIARSARPREHTGSAYRCRPASVLSSSPLVPAPADAHAITPSNILDLHVLERYATQELPLECWTQDYKTVLDALIQTPHTDTVEAAPSSIRINSARLRHFFSTSVYSRDSVV